MEPTTPVPTPLADRTTAKVSGAAALWLLNDEADDWQRATAPELRGHYLTTIDYVTANMSRWKTTAELQPKIEAAAHAYRGRSLMVYATWSFVFLVGVALGVASKTLLKAGSANDGVDQVLSGALGAAVLTAAKQAVKMPFLEVHKERASLWKKLLDKLRAALAKAQAET